MNASRHARAYLLVAGLIVVGYPVPALAQSATGDSTSGAAQQVAERGGQHDFDFEIGTWRTQLRLLRRPLTGSTTWAEYEGKSVVRKVWDGRANLVELDVEGPGGRIEGLSLRLYNPEARQWSLNLSNIRNGTLTPPVSGEFYGMDWLNGRAILVRFIISDITPTSARFEQAFSDDAGNTCEVNWIAIDTRVDDDSR